MDKEIEFIPSSSFKNRYHVSINNEPGYLLHIDEIRERYGNEVADGIKRNLTWDRILELNSHLSKDTEDRRYDR